VCGFTALFLVFVRRAFIFQSIKMKQKSCSITRSTRNAYATLPVIELRLRFFFGSDLKHTIAIFVFLFPFRTPIFVEAVPTSPDSSGMNAIELAWVVGWLHS